MNGAKTKQMKWLEHIEKEDKNGAEKNEKDDMAREKMERMIWLDHKRIANMKEMIQG